MCKLSHLREQLNLTQEELSEKSGLSVRTIQRIESGQAPKGYTLKALAAALGVDEAFFSRTEGTGEKDQDEMRWNKIINISALPCAFLPPLNIVVPLAIMYLKKQNNSINRKLVSVQILWTLIALFLLVIVLILTDWLGIKSPLKMLIPIIWLSVNIITVTTNAFLLGKGKQYIYPDINLL
jgi:transcriptional regulator with XRE-family HTH domain